jgi:hypothetical protein
MSREAAAEPPRIKTIEEHPVVLSLVQEIERLKKAHLAQCDDHAKTIRERDQKYTAEKVTMQELTKYTRAADRKRMGREATAKLIESGK